MSALDLGPFEWENLITILSLLITIILGYYTLKYKKQEIESKNELRDYKKTIDTIGIVQENRSILWFSIRDSMLDYIISQYDSAKKGDLIWGQCVSCSSYKQALDERIYKATQEGVNFKIIFNINAPSINQIRSKFEVFKNAKFKFADDNKIRIHGLSEKEVVISVRGMYDYSGICIKDVYFIKIIKDWFDSRWDNLAQ